MLTFLIKRTIRIIILNIFSALRFFFKKDVELCSSGFGNFSGHTKYFFLNSANKRVYWVAKRNCEFQLLCKDYDNVVLMYSFKYWYLLMRSYKFHITHNVTDVFFVKPRGVYVVNHWHGIAIKKIGFDSFVERSWLNAKLAVRDRLPYDDWDLFYCQSYYHLNLIERAFKIDKKKLVVKIPESINYLKANYKGGRGVLYVPTFRNSSEISVSHEIVIKKIQSKFGIDVPISIKLHPLDEVDLEGLTNVTVLDRTLDVFQALVYADYLVTDYSSVLYDFYQATSKKVYLVQEDLEQYSKYIGGLYQLDQELLYEVIK